MSTVDPSDFWKALGLNPPPSITWQWPVVNTQPSNIGWSYIDPVTKYTELVSDMKPTLLPPEHGVFYYPASGLTALNSFWSRWARL